jgi:hypothetical protein
MKFVPYLSSVIRTLLCVPCSSRRLTDQEEGWMDEGRMNELWISGHKADNKSNTHK